MKYLLNIIIILFCIQVKAQEINSISGVVTYKFTPKALNDSISKKKSDIIKEMYKKMDLDVKFILTFNKNASIFSIEKKMDNDFNPIAYKATKVTVLGGSYYTNLKERVLIKKVNIGSEELLVNIKPSTNSEWQITKENKIINGYKCFKAIKTKTISNSKGAFNFEIVAWFTPEISTSFGVKEFNGLPGLILELNDAHHMFYAENVKLHTKKEIKVLPFEGDVITEREYSKLLKERMSFIYDN